MYIGAMEALGLKVWDIENDQLAIGYLNLVYFRVDPLHQSGPLAFHSMRDRDSVSNDDAQCEYQLQLYLRILMNTRMLETLYGFLIFTKM